MNRRDFLYMAAGTTTLGVAKRATVLVAGAESAASSLETSSRGPEGREPVPIIHCTDLFHPPDDPDDHVDLVTVFALPELDIRAIILDLGHQQRAKPGEIPVKQMMALTGRKAPHAVGLAGPLRYPEDTGENQSRGAGAGIELILRVLRESDRKVCINTAGSVRDVAAAFNRDEALFRSKVARIYVNAGNSAPTDTEWNTVLDPQAYIRIMNSDLPVYWCPCFGGRVGGNLPDEGQTKFREYQTHWKFRQGDIHDALPAPLQNFFLYGLGRKVVSLEDPIAYLNRLPETELKQKEWAQTRHMWCTGPLIHAANRQLYRQQDSWAALLSPAPGFQLSPVFDFVPAAVTVDRDLRATLKLAGAAGNLKVFRILDTKNYEKAMTSALRRLLVEMPLAGRVA